MDEPLTSVTLTWEERQLAVLCSTYPGWEITYQPDKDEKLPWQARRRTRPTPLQHKFGIRILVYRSTGEALGAVLDRMVYIAHTVR
ncbi:hypothetical protein ACQP25_17775 [Microtetraspora malaysiensis]|uniref:hypothetical protein n=1 Tax=Microtetraspora malaysiensis TaxID=161358 RepID=UPI003D8C33A5